MTETYEGVAEGVAFTNEELSTSKMKTLPSAA